jgi:hypothetical protein
VPCPAPSPPPPLLLLLPPPPRCPWTCRSTPWGYPAPRIWDWPEDLRFWGCHWKRLPPPCWWWRRSHPELRLVVEVSAACPPSCLYGSGTASPSDPPVQGLGFRYRGHPHILGHIITSLVTSSHRPLSQHPHILGHIITYVRILGHIIT